MALSKGANDTTRLNANISKDLHKEFQIACLKQDDNMTNVLVNFIKKYVALTNK